MKVQEKSLDGGNLKFSTPFHLVSEFSLLVILSLIWRDPDRQKENK